MRVLGLFVLFLLQTLSTVRVAGVDEPQLLFSIALFRHGQRAGVITDDGGANADLFKYGIGELTEHGMNNSYQLGKWLRKRYVEEKKLLSATFNPKELYIQSVDVARCLMTAEAVGQGMFNTDGRKNPLPVAVKSRPRDSDWILGFTWSKCAGLGKEFARKCPAYPLPISDLKDYHKYERQSWKCSDPAYKGYYNTDKLYDQIEPLIAVKLAGGKVPDWYKGDLEKEGTRITEKALRFQLGLGEFHNPRILRFGVGLLVDTIIKELSFKWKCSQDTTNNKDCKAIKPIKFRAFSTQDFIINSVLETFGEKVRTEGLSPFGSTQYNGLLLFELYNTAGKPEVKILTKQDAFTTATTTVSKHVRGCPDREFCPLEKFENCCNEYRTTDPKHDCDTMN